MGGQWGTITFEVPDFLNTVRDNLNSVTEFLVALLDVALAIAQFIKTFAVGFLDPIVALVQAILDEVESILNDLRALDIYLAGDWRLLDYPFTQLQGGFSEYERRMIARMTDRSDPTTPDISGNTQTAALFFYLSADASEIQRLISFVRQLLAFFRQDVQAVGGLPTPTLTEILYGSDAFDIMHASSLPAALAALGATPPGMALVKWVLSSNSQRSGFDPLGTIPPGGFVITVSTFQDGIKVLYDRPQPNSTTIPQPRVYGAVTVNGQGSKPLVLFGGADMINLPNNLQYNRSLNADGTIKDGKTRVYGQRVTGPDQIIPLELLKDGDTYYFQRTFYIPTSVVSASAFMGDFSEILKLEDMPHNGKLVVGSDGVISIEDAGVATTVYVRVASCTEEVVTKTFKYDFSLLKGLENAVNGAPAMPVPVQNGVLPSDISAWSMAQRVTYPSANTEKYIEALKSALAVLVLSRPDLTPLDLVQDTLSPEVVQSIRDGKYIPDGLVLERCGLEGMKQLTGMVYEDYKGTIQQKGMLPVTFRADLTQRIEKAAHDIYNHTGTMPDVEQFIVEQTELLRTVTWKDIFKEVHPGMEDYLSDSSWNATLLHSLDPEWYGWDNSDGLASNPFGVGCTESIVQSWFEFPGLIRDRDPQMVEGSTGSFEVVTTATAVQAAILKTEVTPGMWEVYQKGLQPDGSIIMSSEDEQALQVLAATKRTEGSADLSPVFYVDQADLQAVVLVQSVNRSPQNIDNTGVFYCRGLFAKYQGGKLFQQAALALSVAAASIQRSRADGEWWSFRFFDSFPSIEDCLDSVVNALESLKGSLDSIVALIVRYISYLEARVVEIQQFILRVNALLQSILGFTFQIPQCSALVLLGSNGSGGVLSDFVSSANKPSDSPLAYGAGVVALIPYGPGQAMDIVAELFKPEPGVDPSPTGTLGDRSTLPPDAIGIEDLPAPPVPPPGPPDVL
jgi:hypothetical protein